MAAGPSVHGLHCALAVVELGNRAVGSARHPPVCADIWVCLSRTLASPLLLLLRRLSCPLTPRSSDSMAQVRWEDKRLLSSVANQAGVAFESIRLAEKMAQQLIAERRTAYE